MLGGLVHETEGGPQVTAAQTATAGQSGGNNEWPAATVTSTTTNAGATGTAPSGQGAVDDVDSHLDSFFQSHALTREDVLVLAALVQLVAWMVLLYLEVSE